MHPVHNTELDGERGNELARKLCLTSACDEISAGRACWSSKSCGVVHLLWVTSEALKVLS